MSCSCCNNRHKAGKTVCSRYASFATITRCSGPFSVGQRLVYQGVEIYLHLLFACKALIQVNRVASKLNAWLGSDTDVSPFINTGSAG